MAMCTSMVVEIPKGQLTLELLNIHSSYGDPVEELEGKDGHWLNNNEHVRSFLLIELGQGVIDKVVAIESCPQSRDLKWYILHGDDFDTSDKLEHLFSGKVLPWNLTHVFHGEWSPLKYIYNFKGTGGYSATNFHEEMATDLAMLHKAIKLFHSTK